MLKEYKADQIRNVAIVGHGGTGKSTLFDAMLMVGGKVDKIGTPNQGTLTSDFDDDEKKRMMSIRSALGFVELDGVKINFIDTPGTADFIGEARAAIQVAETVILVVDAVDGVQIETEKAWRYLAENNIPRIIFVNKMDKERASFEKVMENIKTGLKANIAPLCIPSGEADTFAGVIDLYRMKLQTPKAGGKDVAVADVPADVKAKAEAERTKLVEVAAEGDDALIEKFLEGEALTDDEIKKGLQAQLANAKLFPVVCGSSLSATGVKNLLNVIKDFAPAPKIGREYAGHDADDASKEIKIPMGENGTLAAVVWKTYIDQYAGRFNYLKVISGSMLPDVEVFNPNRKARERISKLYTMVGSKQEEMPKINAGDIGVVVKLDKTATGDTLCDSKKPLVLTTISFPNPVFSYAIEVVNKAEVDKVGQFFTRVTEENPTLTYAYNAETAESVLSGMGEIQLGIVLNSLKEKNKIEVRTREPRVPYRETITKKAESNYRHKKQSGGHGQFGEVYIRMAPKPRGSGFEFKETIFGGAIPKQYIPGVEKGIIEALNEGVLGKFPVVDVEVELYDGKYHDVDSSELSFKIASRTAFKMGMEKAGPQLLEPIMDVNIYVDKQFMGDILSDVTSRRGKVLGMESADETGGSVSVIRAQIPLAEMLRYTIDLRGMTSGKATFEMKFSHYDPISGREADNVIAARKKLLEEEANK
ncbi:MAG TPA: elongation factor G [Spirochaetota bacterium]|nr:elongation factor G [Spirochaetota bacterium]HPC42234.1 elongation factor G [Spirochaetota bacterium]HPL17093.1 elongation factor G [Spirochaetota bacterium]HQF08196.1 elongation factor G [Spirochaetota bacterium]HQH97189.1 elongation factor G [Spirochaetota bacterium]